jgi:hypothetical protein
MIYDIVSTKEFQVLWGITNNKITKCKNCQYRYICLDNSALLFKNQTIYKKTNCNYDPFKNIWTI